MTKPDFDRHLDRAERLEQRLRAALQTKADVLQMYREWLDGENIPAETDGWPSEEAYGEQNIHRFILEVREP
jgi:hypothetical protein